MARVHDARADFEQVIQRHAGDRNTFDLMLDSLGDGWNSDRLELSRKLAFQGSSGVWGVRSRVRVTQQIIAPNAADPAWLDFSLTGGYVDCQRFRSNVRWPLFHIQSVHDDGTPMPRHQNGDSEQPPREIAFVDEFCSDNMPELLPRRRGDTTVFELGEGPIGRQGEFTTFFRDISRRMAPRYRTSQDTTGRVVSSVFIPSEFLMFDLIYHRDLLSRRDVVAAVYGMLPGSPGIAASRGLEDALPIPEQPIELARGLTDVATPLVPTYAAMVQRTLETCGWNPDDFAGVRLQVKYPPLHSVASFEFPLPDAP